MIVMSYFHTWTSGEEFQSADVTRVSMFGVLKEKPQFTLAGAKWLDGGVLTMEMQNVVQGFMSVTRVRPRDPDAEGDNSDNQPSDEECFVSKEDLAEALVTKAGGRAGKEGQDGDRHHLNALEGIALVQKLWSSSNVATGRKRAVVPVPLSTLDTKGVIDAARKLRVGDAAARDGVPSRVKQAQTHLPKLPSSEITSR